MRYIFIILLMTGNIVKRFSFAGVLDFVAEVCFLRSFNTFRI